MNLRKKMFGEARFVFAEGVPEVPAVAAAVEVVPEVDSKALRDQLKLQIDDNARATLLAENLIGKSIKQNLSAAMDFKNDAFKGEFVENLETQISGLDFTVLKNTLGLSDEPEITDEELKGVFVDLYAESLLAGVEQRLNRDFYLTDYVSAPNLGNIGSFSFSLEFGSGGSISKVNLEGTDEAYKIFKTEKDKQKIQAQALSDGDAEKARQKAEIDKKVLALKNSPFGATLLFLGFGNADDKGVTGFEKIASGENSFFAIIAGMLGVDGFSEGYEAFKAGLPESVQKSVDKIEKKARAHFDKKQKKIDDAVLALLSLDIAPKTMGAIIQRHNVDDKLSEAFVAPENKALSINTYSGKGLLIIPANSEYSLMPEGTKEFSIYSTGEKEETFAFGILKFNKLPAGTIISKEAKVELV